MAPATPSGRQQHMADIRAVMNQQVEEDCSLYKEILPCKQYKQH